MRGVSGGDAVRGDAGGAGDGLEDSVSGADGHFGFIKVKPGASVTVQAWADGFTTATKTLTAAELES